MLGITPALRQAVISFLLLARCRLLLITPGQKHLFVSEQTSPTSGIGDKILTNLELLGQAEHRSLRPVESLLNGSLEFSTIVDFNAGPDRVPDLVAHILTRNEKAKMTLVRVLGSTDCHLLAPSKEREYNGDGQTPTKYGLLRGPEFIANFTDKLDSLPQDLIRMQQAGESRETLARRVFPNATDSALLKVIRETYCQAQCEWNVSSVQSNICDPDRRRGLIKAPKETSDDSFLCSVLIVATSPILIGLLIASLRGWCAELALPSLDRSCGFCCRRRETRQDTRADLGLGLAPGAASGTIVKAPALARSDVRVHNARTEQETEV